MNKWEQQKQLCLYKGKSYINEIINSWKIIGYHSTKQKPSGSAVLWLCECLECGIKKILYPYNIFSNRSKKCFSCSMKNTVGSNNHNWKGYGDIPSSVITAAKNNAKTRNIKFKVTPSYLEKLWLKQNKKCALSGEELVMRPKSFKGKNAWTNTASLDRIDSKKGYIPGNVQWVHPIVNMMKNHFNELLFLEFCKKIYNYKKEII